MNDNVKKTTAYRHNVQSMHASFFCANTVLHAKDIAMAVSFFVVLVISALLNLQGLISIIILSIIILSESTRKRLRQFTD